ncbi:11542_t:CDS:1, partial [Gigaspora rosea]
TNLNVNKKNTKLVENEASHAHDHDNEQMKRPVETDEDRNYVLTVDVIREKKSNF